MILNDFMLLFYITVDIDECENGMHNCHLDATCVDTPGNFTCTCNDGYNGDGMNCSGW